MSQFTAFATEFGAMLVALAIIASWLFRSSSAALGAKIVVPALLVALACATPFAVLPMMGSPVAVSAADLPRDAELVAFVPHDEDKRVDLWLIVGQGTPRAFETELTGALKQTLREAQQAMAQGQRVLVTKRPSTGGRGAGDRLGIDDNATYVVDAGALSNLPPKE